MSKVVTIAKTAEEYERIFRFRYSIYVEEMGKPMPDADHTHRVLYDDLDDRSTHLYAQREGEVIGAIRIIWGSDGLPAKYLNWYGLDRFSSIPQEEISFTGRLMVSEKLRSSVVSMVLARQAYCLGRERGISFDFIHTTSDLVPFFERLGHRPYTSEFIDPDLGSRMPMVLALGDLAHLQACQSPFASLAVSLNHHRPERVVWFRNEFKLPLPQ
jgi:predicted GNAT family N-acyltransferase